jgi:hypothetical protein
MSGAIAPDTRLLIDRAAAQDGDRLAKFFLIFPTAGLSIDAMQQLFLCRKSYKSST